MKEINRKNKEKVEMFEGMKFIIIRIARNS